MLTEYEVESLIEIPEVQAAIFALKKDFIRSEAPYLELSDHDFFSLIMMAPTIGMAMADGSISLFEELALNKKARKLSKGGYFLKKDPVEYAMKFLIKKFDDWRERFFGVLNLAMHKSFEMDKLEMQDYTDKPVSYEEYKRTVLNTPYILIRFITSFFLENEEDIISNKRVIGKKEFQLLRRIGDEVGLSRVPVFQMFCKTFEIK